MPWEKPTMVVVAVQGAQYNLFSEYQLSNTKARLGPERTNLFLL
jgi:hypothetical protein